MATRIPDNRAEFSVEEILEATSGQLVAGPASARGAGVFLDSRRVTRGSIFVALVGERHDSHDFLEDVASRGAAVVIAEREVALGPGVAVVRVSDTGRALMALGGAHRDRLTLTVVALTGSVGKTGTKELIAAALRSGGARVAATNGNLNNQVGVPMTLLAVTPEDGAAVVEIGMNAPGEIASLAAIVRPDVALVTSVEAAHTEGVGDLRGVAREKGALLDALGPDGVAVHAHRYPQLADHAPRAGRRLTYGASSEATVRLVSADLRLGEGGPRTHARFRVDGEPPRESGAELALLGSANAENAAGAMAVVEALGDDRRAALGLSWEGVFEALASVRPTPQRLEPKVLEGGGLVLDDTYNASPASTEAALFAARELAELRAGRLVVVFGDMMELGHGERAHHERVGEAVVEAGAFALVTVGERASHAARSALRQPSERRVKIVILREVEDVASCVLGLPIEPRDVILVKGSRSMRMERVVTALEAATSTGDGAALADPIAGGAAPASEPRAEEGAS